MTRRPRWLPGFLYDTELPLILWVVLCSLWLRVCRRRPRQPPQDPRRILVAHHLLLGDTILLAPLLAKLRARHPEAEIVLTTPLPMVELYAARPYGLTIRPFGLRRIETVLAMAREPGFDLAVIPGDNRHAWLAAALDARWIVAHAGDRPFYKNWLVDELLPYPDAASGIGDIFAQLVPGPAPTPFRSADWPMPPCKPFELPTRPYAVMHVGASTPLKRWPAENWRELAVKLAALGLEIVWSGGPREAGIVREIDPEQSHRSYAERLGLAQLWQLVAGAALLVAPDTGVAHLARLTGTPTATLFGPGSAVLFGRGDYWRDTPCEEITIDDFACRNQPDVFRRQAGWIRRCSRTTGECPRARCMEALDVERVLAACRRLLMRAGQGATAPVARSRTILSGSR